MEPIAFAHMCRGVGLAFVRGVALGWESPDLERWLVEYRKLATEPRGPTVTARFSGAKAIQPLTDLLRETRWKVFAALELAQAGDARFVQQIAGERLIERDRERLWVPVDRKSATLRGRVLSLFAVDCLLRPGDYRTMLLACPRCESVVFDARARAAGRCCDRVVASGARSIVPESLQRKTR